MNIRLQLMGFYNFAWKNKENETFDAQNRGLLNIGMVSVYGVI